MVKRTHTHLDSKHIKWVYVKDLKPGDIILLGGALALIIAKKSIIDSTHGEQLYRNTRFDNFHRTEIARTKIVITVLVKSKIVTAQHYPIETLSYLKSHMRCAKCSKKPGFTPKR